MPRMAINQMTMLHAPTCAVLDRRQASGFEGVELRNDLDGGLFGGSLRLKEDAVAVGDDMGRPECFGLVPDTFDPAIAGQRDVIHVVHISGLRNQAIALAEMHDPDRSLVDAHDRLGTVTQINTLCREGSDGPLPFEAFAPDIHTLDDPTPALLASTTFITSGVALNAVDLTASI